MKRFSVAIVLFLAFAYVLASAKEELKAANKKCNESPETAANLEEHKKWREEGGPRPANSGAHTLCMCLEMGWMTPDNKISEVTLREKLASVPEADRNVLIKKCAVEKEKAEATAIGLMDCVIEDLRKHSSSGTL